MKNPCEYRRQYDGKWMACEFHNDLHSKMWEPCPSCQKRVDHDKSQYNPYIRTRGDFTGVYEPDYRAMEVEMGEA